MFHHVENQIIAKCPLCAYTDFQRGEIVFNPILTINPDESFKQEDRFIPMVQLICKRCRHISFLEAVPIFGLK